VYVQEGHCGFAFLADRVAIVSNLPDSLPLGRAEYLVRGTLSADDPCGLQGLFFPAYYLVTAREVTPD
jgi:hypothetical protein